MFRTIRKFIYLFLVILLWQNHAFAAEPARQAIGFNIDILPTVLSASAGTVGGAGQVWYARNHLRFRLVGAHFRMPESIMKEDYFRKQETTAIAVICDYVTGKEFNSFWVGSGLELWLNRIGYLNSSNTASWNNAVFTMGGGYIWKFYRNFFLDPWAAVHVLLNKQQVHLQGDTYKPQAITAEASLKIGWYFDLK